MAKQPKIIEIEKGKDPSPIFGLTSSSSIYTFNGINKATQAKEYILDHPFLARLNDFGLVGYYSDSNSFYGGNIAIDHNLGTLDKTTSEEEGFVLKKSDIATCGLSGISSWAMKEYLKTVNMIRSSDLINRLEERDYASTVYTNFVTKPLKTSSSADELVKLIGRAEKMQGTYHGLSEMSKLRGHEKLLEVISEEI